MDVVSFARGVPAPECLPVAEMADCARAVIERDGRTVLSYGPGGGYGPLREWIAARHGVEPARVVVTTSSLQGFGFLADELVGAGNRVFVEAPAYDRPLKILSRLRAEVVAVPLDDEGLDSEVLERDLRDGPPPAFLYTNPTFQNPSGRTLSLERRRHLIEIAHEHDLFILEDDPYGLVRFEGEPLPTLFDLDGRGERVAYASSFSKTIAPGVRVGYLVLPHGARREGGGARRLDVHLAAVPDAGDRVRVPRPRHLRAEPRARQRPPQGAPRRDARRARRATSRRRRAGATRRAATSSGSTCRRTSAPTTSRSPPRASGSPSSRASDFFAGHLGGEHELRLAYSFVSPEQIAEGVSRLAPLLRSAAAPAPAL